MALVQGSPGSAEFVHDEFERNRRARAAALEWDRPRVAAMFAGTGLFVLVYLLLVLTRISGSALLFLVLPFFSSLLVANLVSRREHIMSTCFLSMLFNGAASFFFLGEGFICVLMASPLFMGMTWLGACLARSARFGSDKPANPRRWTIVLVAGALLGYAAWDARVLALGAPERTVANTYEIAAPRETVWRALSFDRPPTIPLPAWLFAMPLPERYAFGAQGAGAIRFVDFGAPVNGDDADRPRGRMVFRVAAWDPGRRAVFVCTRNETRIGGWLELIETRVELEDAASDANGGRTRVTLTTRYRRKLGPALYYETLMDAGIAAMHDVLAGELREGAR
ncbi:MAG: hypothetical protein HY291_13920 [Planctomycetes bacterium]|nr:hypothetical protein [Planctomycetota bacterium]